jgi:hypothetical protein
MKITAAELIKSLSEKRNSDTCFIIGGGSSLLKYLPDHSVLEHKDVITTNNAYKLFPNALVGHFADNVWYNWHRNVVHKIFKNQMTTTIRSGADYRYPEQVTTFIKEKGNQIVLSTSQTYLAGNNSGHQAINLAYLIGFKIIILLGFDMTETKNTHWHNEHKKTTRTMLYQHTMIPCLEKLSKEIKNVQIFNINKESGIKCFPFADLKDFL